LEEVLKRLSGILKVFNDKNAACARSFVRHGALRVGPDGR
jgi:hypothetical protein